MQLKSAAGLVILILTCVSGHPNIWQSDALTPVHGLYVKPSADGTKGDLFVAATEENGVKSQWTLDQPISILPVSTQPQAASVPVAYSPVYATHEESTLQKRSALTTPTPSAPVQYAYAMPVSSTTPVETTGTAASYPYAYTMTATATATETPKCEHQTNAVQYPYQFPYHMFYPQMMMSAYTNAMSILKDAGFSEDSANSVMAHASPMWSPTSYAYPMYVVIDPKPCSQEEATTTTPTPTSTSTTPNSSEEETTQP
ncbi:uncharacterized protein LOC118266986 [Spodoptera frugiperda]|uniref:Uncharacterized protein LOC118266986 n=1 Tax=Spodoptera frugiperda TaxID=7108 RepID=A0A9R0D166_SPOFR|nr:uncharacterized protein LOC118266986 [Spodoptera frugiperda]